MSRLLVILAALLAPMPALAANSVKLTSDVFREKQVADASGSTRTVLEAPKLVVPGDRLLFVLDYRNTGAQPATDFVVTNPLPAAVAFQDVPDAAATVSVDGGRTWGRLAALRVRNADGTLRPALNTDVTHVRWAMASAIPVGGGGKVSFRGTVK